MAVGLTEDHRTSFFFFLPSPRPKVEEIWVSDVCKVLRRPWRRHLRHGLHGSQTISVRQGRDHSVDKALVKQMDLRARVWTLEPREMLGECGGDRIP